MTKPTKFTSEVSKPNLAVGLAIACGEIENAKHINKFGFSDSVGDTYQTIWEGENLYTYPSSADTVALTSTESSDDNGGTVLVQGLDANYDETEETITIGAGAGSVEFIRVFRMILTSANTGSSNVGEITATLGTGPGVVVGKIYADQGQSLMAQYTIPNGYKGYLTHIQATVERKDKDSRKRLMARPFGYGFNVKGQWSSNGNPIEYVYDVPLVFDAKTDIQMQIQSSADTAVSGIFNLILIDHT